MIPGFFGDLSSYVLVSVPAVTLALIICVARSREIRRADPGTVGVLSCASFWITLGLIVISPHATRHEHYGYTSPALEIVIGATLLVLFDHGKRVWMKAASVLGGAAFIAGFLFVSNGGVAQANVDKGTGVRTHAIFDLHRFYKERWLRPEEGLFVNWAMSEQIYVLARGQFRSGDIVVGLMGATSDQARHEIRTRYFSSGAIGKTPVYLPMYRGRFVEINQSVFEFISANGARLVREKVLYEADGVSPVIDSWKLEDPEALRRRLTGQPDG